MKAGTLVLFEGHEVACPLCHQSVKYAADTKAGERVAVTCVTPGCVFGDGGVEVTAGTVSDPKLSAAIAAGNTLATGGHDEAPTVDEYAAARPVFEVAHAAAMETIRSLRPGDTIQQSWLVNGWIDWEVRAVLVEDERVVARRLYGERWAYEIAAASGFHVGLWRKKP